MAKKDYSYLLSHLADFQNDLLDSKQVTVAPIKAFMRGAQRAIYDEAIAFLREEEANFVELPPDEVAPLRSLAGSSRPYVGGLVPAGKVAVTKLRALLAELLKAEREKATDTLCAQEERLATVPDFSTLSSGGREQVMMATVAARKEILSARFASGIRDRVQRYVNQEYPAQVALAARLVAPKPSPAPAPSGSLPVIPAAPVHQVEYIPSKNLALLH